VHSWLELRRGGSVERVELHASLQKATVRRAVSLTRGTWTTSLVFEDGSGNRATRAGSDVVVR
jgi:hypothetical protein